MAWNDLNLRTFVFRTLHVIIFLVWIIAVWLALRYFYSTDGNVSIIYGTKVIKFISLAGIFFHLFLWLVGAVTMAVEKKRETWPCLFAACCVALVTLVIGVVLGIELVRAYDKAAGGADVLYAAGSIWSVVGDNMYTLIPICCLMGLNIWLVKGSSTSEVSSEARSYLRQIDFPCIATSIIVFTVAYLSDGFVDLRELSFSLGGAMSFLVFLVFFNECLLGILKKY